MDSFEALRVDRLADGVAQVELCRPELLNRFDQTLHGELPRALHELAVDRDVHAVVLASTGRYFSAGGDTDIMREAATDPQTRYRLVDEGRRLFRALADFPKPLVVALAGDAYGLGATVALLTDAVVTTPEVRIADTHVKMAIAAGDGGGVAWPANMPLLRAKRHLLTGDPLTGAEAHGFGLVSDLVDDVEDVLPAAIALAERMASLPPLAVQLTKRLLNQTMLSRATEVLDLGFYLEAATLASDDLQEAVDAFTEKREARWRGR